MMLQFVPVVKFIKKNSVSVFHTSRKLSVPEVGLRSSCPASSTCQYTVADPTEPPDLTTVSSTSLPSGKRI